MKNLKQIFDILEDNNITIHDYKENDKLCGYELDTYTPGGVNQIIFLDFREEGKPKNPEDFKQKFLDWINGIDVDEEIDVHRQDRRYIENFTVRESLEDFEAWEKNLYNIYNLIK